VLRRVQPGDHRRSEAIGSERRASAANALVRLQRSAGNRAVGRLLARAPAPSIAVHKGSKLKAADFVSALKTNKKVPDWLKKGLSAKGDTIALAGDLKPPSDKIWLFDESFAKAFASHSWEITTAKSTIQVTKGKDGKLAWQQLVSPDLESKEQLGHWMKTGRDEVEFSRDPPLDSQLAEVIYGWTVPDSATPLSRDKLNLVVIVTEIEVTAPNGRKKTFKPSADSVAEAIIHEISVHAGRISQGLPDAHDGSAVIQEMADQVGGFFRDSTASGALELGATSKEILAFVGGK
jgi:hypothetical protein